MLNIEAYVEDFDSDFVVIIKKLRTTIINTLPGIEEKLSLIKEEIKAVTFHQLKIIETTKGFETIIIFDI